MMKRMIWAAGLVLALGAPQLARAETACADLKAVTQGMYSAFVQVANKLSDKYVRGECVCVCVCVCRQILKVSALVYLLCAVLEESTLKNVCL